MFNDDYDEARKRHHQRQVNAAVFGAILTTTLTLALVGTAAVLVFDWFTP